MNYLGFFFCVFLVLEVRHIFGFHFVFSSQFVKSCIFVELNIPLFISNDFDLFFGKFLIILDKHLKLGPKVIDFVVLFGNEVPFAIFLVGVNQVTILYRKIKLKLFVNFTSQRILEDLVCAICESKVFYTFDYPFELILRG